RRTNSSATAPIRFPPRLLEGRGRHGRRRRQPQPEDRGAAAYPPSAVSGPWASPARCSGPVDLRNQGGQQGERASHVPAGSAPARPLPTPLARCSCALVLQWRAAVSAVSDVRVLDLGAGDAEQEEDLVEEWVVHGCVCHLAKGRLRVEGDTKARGREHVDIARTVA